MRSTLLVALAAGAPAWAVDGRAAEAGSQTLFDHFSPTWRVPWREQRLFAKPTVYDVASDSGQPVLHAISRSANAALVREVARPAPTAARLCWRWKVRDALTGNARERQRAGDDYAARVFVVFETSWLPLRTRAINYVWAAHEPAGSMFASPYTANVGIIVLRSGAADAGKWQVESRDALADYRAFFGVPPTRISAVAVLVDTDNTGREAEAWFADLILETKPPALDAKAP
ncbi:MAG: DUF3047 domain-containing protein [Opitutaceae bacterium]